MITVPVCRKFIGTLSYGNICLNRVGKRFTYAFHRTNIYYVGMQDSEEFRFRAKMEEELNRLSAPA